MLLDFPAGQFVPGRRYSEKEVNAALGRFHPHPDTASLRRRLAEEGLVERARGEYRCSGGTFTVD